MEYKYISYEESYGLQYYNHGMIFYGSYKGMRYRIEKVTPKGSEEDKESVPIFVVTVWPEPMNYEHTDDSLKVRQEFPFDEDGKHQAVQWLNDYYEKNYLK